LTRLLDEADDTTPTPATQAVKSHQKIPAPPPRNQDHQEALMLHMVQVRTAMMAEAKSKPVQCRKVARMVALYWEREEGKEEREQQALEREQRKKGRDLVKALRKRWGLAVKVSALGHGGMKWVWETQV
jgi:helicase SWR1